MQRYKKLTKAIFFNSIIQFVNIFQMKTELTWVKYLLLFWLTYMIRYFTYVHNSVPKV